jgi:FkbM family methyltransferase
VIWFLIAKLYSRVCRFLGDTFRWRARGLGWVLRQVNFDTVVWVHGAPIFFDHKVGPSYTWLISGEWNEPETHQFLRAVILAVGSPVRFVDVGANVGEMVVDVARLGNVHEVIAFEPNPVCARTLRINALLGGQGHVRVVERVVKDSSSVARFLIGQKAPSGSRIAVGEENGALDFPATTLDVELGDATGPTVVLIDVEGAELRVMEGAREFIRRTRPLLIFEYNELGRSQYTLEAVRAVLGNGYDIYRLGPRGRLDRNLTDTWNCVAVSKGSMFCEVCRTLEG